MSVHREAVVRTRCLKVLDLRQNLKLPSTLFKVDESTLHCIIECCVQHGQDSQVSAQVRDNPTTRGHLSGAKLW